VVQAGFILWWTVPALVAVSVVLYRRVMTTGAKGI